MLSLFGRIAVNHPEAIAHLLGAIDFHLAPTKEIALVSPPDADGLGELAAPVRERFLPHVVIAGGREGTERPELMRERTAVEGVAAAYVCENFACKRPVTDAEQLAAALDG